MLSSSALRNDNLLGSKESGKEDELLGGEEYEEIPARSLAPSRSIVEDAEILGGSGGDEDFGRDGEEEALGSKEDDWIFDCMEGSEGLGRQGGRQASRC